MVASAFDILIKENPIIARVGSDPFALAKYAANVEWVLKCDKEFFYEGSRIITPNASPAMTVQSLLSKVCDLLNNAASDLTKTGQHDLFSNNFINKLRFEVRDGSIVTEVRGVRDVPSLYPVRDLTKKLDDKKAGKIPSDVAMAMFTDSLLKSLSKNAANNTHMFTQDELSSALSGISNNLAKPQPNIAQSTFAAKLELERQNKVQQVVTVA